MAFGFTSAAYAIVPSATAVVTESSAIAETNDDDSRSIADVAASLLREDDV